MTEIALKSEIRDLMKQHFKYETKIYGFYTSIFDRIIVDEELMVIPIYDRQFHRGHSVFDNLDIIKGRSILFDERLQRLTRSCSLAKIPLPMAIEEIKEKIIDLASFCLNYYNLHQSHLFIRIWVSSGGKNFGILPPINNKSNLFVVAYQHQREKFRMFDEVSINSVIPKEGILANSKTTNYLINTLFAIDGVNNGGKLGIMLDKNGFILEQPIANIAFVFKNGDFVVSKFEKILKGITLLECIKYIEENLIKNGKIKRIIQMNIKPLDVYNNASEMLILGGNCIYPIRKFDNYIISNEPGPISILLRDHLQFLKDNSPYIPFDRYKNKIPHSKL